MNVNIQNDVFASGVKRKHSLESTTSSLKSKKSTFRKEQSSLSKLNKIKGKNIINLNKSRNIVNNLPICISQFSNLDYFKNLSTNLSPKENKNNSLNHQNSKEMSFDNEQILKSCNNNNNNKNFIISSNKVEENKSFKYCKNKNTNYLIISELLSPTFDKYSNFKNFKYINSPKSNIKSEKENSYLKLSPIKLKSNLKLSNMMNSPIGNFKYKIKSIDHKAFLNKSILNNNSLIENVSNNISKNISDINIFLKKTNNKEDQNLSSFDLSGSKNITNIKNVQRNNNIYSNIKSSFNKLSKIKKLYGIPKLNKNLFLSIDKSLFEDKKNNIKNKHSPNLCIIKNNNKDKLTKLILNKKSSSDKELKNNAKKIIQKENEKQDSNMNNIQKQNSKEKKNITLENLNKENNFEKYINNLNKIKQKKVNLIYSEEKSNNLSKQENQIKEDNQKNINTNDKEKEEEQKKDKVEEKEKDINKNETVKRKIKFKNDSIKNDIKESLTNKNNNKKELKKKKTIKLKDFLNMCKSKYSNISIKSEKLKLKKYQFLNNLNKKIETETNHKIDKNLFRSKAGFLLLNTKKTESGISKIYNSYKNNCSITDMSNSEECQTLNIKLLAKYEIEINNEISKNNNIIIEPKYNLNKINKVLRSNKDFSKYILKRYEFDGIELKNNRINRGNRYKRKTLMMSLNEAKEIRKFFNEREKPIKNIENNFPILKSQPLYFNEELNWKYSKTNYMFVHSFILKEHCLELDGEAKKNFNKKSNTKNKLINKSPIKNFKRGLGLSLLSRKSLIHFSPFKKLRRSSSFIDLSIIQKKFADFDKKGVKGKNENINNYSLLTNKKFYNINHKSKSNKILKKNNLLNINEKEDNHFDNKKDSNEKAVKSFLLQLNENYYNIKNKGQFLLENGKTVVDIYVGLSFLIVENNAKMFINKIKELNNSIDINHQFFEGNTFLIMASREGNKNIAYFLCQQHCELNIQNDKGNTALHYAIGNLFFDVVDILISFGANEEILNYNGLRPWDCIEYNLE